MKFFLLIWRMSAIVLYGIKAVLHYGWWRITDRANNKNVHVGRAITGLFKDLGATFIKIGQILSSRPDLLPMEVIQELNELQDNVPSFSWDKVKQCIKEEFGHPWDEVFKTLEHRPIASASVAQVHVGTVDDGTPDGTKVAVKIQRPSIARRVELDFILLRATARLLEFIPGFKWIGPLEMVGDFGVSIQGQLDFGNECNNLHRFRENFKDFEGVDFPEPIDEYCRHRVLTMKFVEGVKLAGIDEAGIDRNYACKRGMEAVGKMVMEDGLVHADLHPGNILYCEGSETVFLDVGLVGEIDNNGRKMMLDVQWAQFTGNGKEVARIMMENAERQDIRDYDRYEADVVEFVKLAYGKSLGEFEIAKAFGSLFALLRKHRIKSVFMFTMVNVALVTAQGVARQLDGTVDPNTIFLPLMARLLKIPVPDGHFKEDRAGS